MFSSPREPTGRFRRNGQSDKTRGVTRLPQGPSRRLSLLLITASLGIALMVLGCPARVVRDHLTPGTAVGVSHAPMAGSLVSGSGCRINTRLYRPERPRTKALVVLGHGFLREQGRMAGLAEALAVAGIPTVTLDFCNSRVWDGRHVQNGRDMRLVADKLGAQRVIYAGFSAGGLSALVAAWADPRAIGVVTLDLVDDRGLGEGLAHTLGAALVGLQGDPAPCNAQANGLAVFAASPKARLLPITGARHCDFESPTDWLCESVCGRADAEAEARRQEVIDRSVAAVADLLGMAPEAAAIRVSGARGRPQS